MFLKRYIIIYALLISISNIVYSQVPSSAWFHRYTFSSMYRINAVSFTDTMNGWAVGWSEGNGVILHTFDGGETWSEQVRDTISSELKDIALTVDTMGWAVGRGRCYETYNGGKSWELVPQENFQCGEFVGLSDMQSVAIWPPASGVIVGTQNIVANTSDGGQSWNCQNLMLFSSDTLHAVKYLTEDTLIAAGMGVIARSVNGGNDWDTCYDGFYNNDFENFYRIAVVSPLFCWVVSRQSKVMRSRDAGLNWQPLGQVFDDYGIEVQDISFADTLLGWICTTKGNIWETKDGGMSWSKYEITENTSFVQLRTLPGQFSYAINTANQLYVRHYYTSYIFPNHSTPLPWIKLTQGYPNPFNSTVTWTYSLPRIMYIEFSVYNLEGQQITCLAKRNQDAGEFQVQWTPIQQSSGLYLGVLEAEGRRQIRRIIYLK